MNAFKSFAVSLLTAAATLASVAVTTPAQACLSCNGLKLNGISLNGISLNGLKWNGVVLNGPGLLLQGISLNGPILQGSAITAAKPGRFIAVTLPSGERVDLR